ncbi:MAG: SDR family NAD(P)-dependent oxidoreductase [Candidatus Marinimicrobia bacterium]|nr:SDR family NAD(P)-dependent oxidoreductase [Candidatus Neomarinimicrobiota bacterium]
MENLKDKIVMISGASSGIGLASARLFAEQGCRLILFARRYDRLEKIKRDLKRNYSADVHIFQADVREKSALERGFATIPDNFYPIDILINNAGLARGTEKFHEINEQYFDEVLDTNVKGVISVTRKILPQMLERNVGHIINIGSIAGQQAYQGGHIYNASKFALKGLMDAIRIDIVDTDIRVSTIDPGMVNTEFSTVRFYGDKKSADKLYIGIEPLLAVDIAESILFMATRPLHVNINDMTIMPNHQATATIKHFDIPEEETTEEKIED